MAKGNSYEDEQTTLLDYNSSKYDGKLHSGVQEAMPNIPGCISARYTLAFIAFLGMVNLYTLRVNLSVALVAMVNNHSVNSSSDECLPVNHSSIEILGSSTAKAGEFDWDQETQGIILGSFYWGYMVSQIPGGMFAERFGGKMLFGLGVLCVSVLALLTPLAARTSLYLLILLRVLEGVGEGVTIPALYAMWSNWAPVWERSRLVAYTLSGCQLGTVIAMPLSGLMADSDFLGGWPSVFYVFGGLGCIWFIFWMFLAYDTPAKHPRISQEERQYIAKYIRKPKKHTVPWGAVFSSRHVWAILIAHVCANWGFYTLLTSMPIFIEDVLHFEITKNGVVSAFPYLAECLVISAGGVIADYLRKNNRYLTTTNTRKLLVAIGFLTPAIFLALTGYIGCNYTMAIVFLTLAVGLSGLAHSGHLVNHLDIAPIYAGTLLGITNSAATIPGIAGPYVVGVLTNENQTIEQWRIVFYIASAIYIFGAIFYFIFGSGEIQNWATDTPHRRTHDDGGKEG